jgi:hypothetical protein
VRLRQWVGGTVSVAIIVAGLLGWLIAPAYTAGPGTAASPPERVDDDVLLTGDDGSARRRDLLARATFRYDPVTPAWPQLDECSFVPDEPSGTTPKFDCLFADGSVMKVKYGKNAEPHAEVAATRVLAALGYATDHVVLTPRLRCHGCPRYPFIAMHLGSGLQALGITPPAAVRKGYTDFRWVSVERKFGAPAAETELVKGWSWWELRGSKAPRHELDAFRLLAVFLAHWDNKAGNQRLVCLDAECSRTLAMMQDVGATFGPSKINLERWRSDPIWADRGRCVISMARLPYGGATFIDATISEAGRQLLADAFATVSDDQIREVFAAARFPEFHSGTDDGRDLNAWVSAFKHRVRQITDATCR